jgi:hypothetical protein
MDAQEKWEYHVEEVGSFWSGAKPEELQELLNAMGQDGWKLVSAVPIQNTNKIVLIARRPLTSRPARHSPWPA